jgi:membrane protease YdiL (CAAX protease family)
MPIPQVLKKHAEPVILHPICQIAYRVMLESIKMVAASHFLDILVERLKRKATHLALNSINVHIKILIVVAPLMEELMFRGVILQGVHLLQKTWNEYAGNQLTQEDEKSQQAFRVRLSAFSFAAAHLFTSKSKIAAAIQFLLCYESGLQWGYISEKYQTLSVGFLSHGLNNACSAAIQIYPEWAILYGCAFIVNQFVLRYFLN